MPKASQLLKTKTVTRAQQNEARLNDGSVHQSSRLGTNLSRSEKAEKVFTSLETISMGLTELDSVGDITDLSGKSLVDAAAKLNKQHQVLEKYLDPMKNKIKSDALQANPGRNRPEITVQGNVYEAVVRRISKTLILADLVRAFVGPKNLHKVQDKRTETTVSFGIKE